MKAFIVIVVLLMGVLWFATQANLNASSQPAPTSERTLPQRRPVKTYDFPQVVNPHQVVYKVSVVPSPLPADCHSIGTTYEMPHGTAQKDVRACGKSTTITIDTRTAQRGDFLYLSVQNDDNPTTIACQIYVDGLLTYHTKSTGEYVIASCSGRLK